MRIHPQFDLVEENENYVIIRDLAVLYRCKSITNGAEEVIAWFHRAGLGKRRLFYIDTMDKIDELVHDGEGHFLNFQFGGPIETI